MDKHSIVNWLLEENLLEADKHLEEARRIDKELKKGPVKYDDITFHAKTNGDRREDKIGYDKSVGYVATKSGDGHIGYVVFEKASSRVFKEYIDALADLIKKVKEIKSLVTGKETDKEIQKIWSLVDDLGHGDYSFKGFAGDFKETLSKNMAKDGWSKDILHLVTDFIEDVDMSFTDLRASLSELGMSNEHIKEFMNSSSYKKILSLRKFSEKMNRLHQTVVAANKYAATKKNIERLSSTIETLETEANTLAKQITK